MIRFGLLLLLLASSAYGNLAASDKVITLTKDTFNRVISGFRHSLVLFYTPEWLTGNPLITGYPEFVKEIHKEYPGILISQLDVTENQALADLYSVTELPTLKLISKMNGATSDYKGDSNSKDIIDWLRKEIGELIIPVTSVQKAQKTFSTNQYVALYLGSESSEDYANFLGWTTSNKDIFFMKSNSQAMKKEFGVTENGFVFSRDYAKENSVLEGPLSIGNLNQWLRTYKYPTVITIKSLTAYVIEADRLDIAVLIKDESAASAQSEKDFEEIAKELRGKLNFGVVSGDKSHGINLMKSFGIKDEQLPAVAILHSTDFSRKYRLDRELTSKSMRIFLLNFFEGNLVNFIRSDPIPDPLFDIEGSIKIVVGDNYKKIVLDEKSDVLIELYSPKCGHCKAFAPTYSTLGQSLEYVKDLLIAKLDATANDADGVDLEGFPTLLFYPRGSKNSPLNYKGVLTVESITEFIKEHGTVKI